MDKFEDALNTIRVKSHYSFENEITLLRQLVNRNKVVIPARDTENFIYLLCPTCGKLLAGDSKQRFCKYCGQRVKE